LANNHVRTNDPFGDKAPRGHLPPKIFSGGIAFPEISEKAAVPQKADLD
jgi:hypothetical protein